MKIQSWFIWSASLLYSLLFSSTGYLMQTINQEPRNIKNFSWFE